MPSALAVGSFSADFLPVASGAGASAGAASVGVVAVGAGSAGAGGAGAGVGVATGVAPEDGAPAVGSAVGVAALPPEIRVVKAEAPHREGGARERACRVAAWDTRIMPNGRARLAECGREIPSKSGA